MLCGNASCSYYFSKGTIFGHGHISLIQAQKQATRTNTSTNYKMNEFTNTRKQSIHVLV